jgi:uracil-DNA glycosylase family 4
MYDLRVPPQGNPQTATYCLVGEAPGKMELAARKPFMGSAGKALYKILSSVGITRSDCYILNVIPIFPVQGVRSYIKLGSKQEITQSYLEYEEELIAQINASSCKIIIPMGDIALFALTRQTGITKRRGSIYEDPRLPGKLIVPTIHPGSTFHMYNYNYYMLYDFKKCKDLADGTLPIKDYVLYIEPTLEEAMNFFVLCMGSLEVGFDIETIKTTKKGKFQNWETSCFSLSAGCYAICIPFLKTTFTQYWSEEDEKLIWRRLTELLENPNIAKIGQNIIFDSSFFIRKHGIIIQNMHDTMATACCTTSEFDRDLGFLTSLYTTVPYYKDEGGQFNKLPEDVHKFWHYSAMDAAVLIDIFGHQKESLTSLNNWDAYKTIVRLLHPCLFMGEHGILMEKEGMDRAAKEARDEIARLVSLFHEQCGRVVNPSSPKQLIEYFYGEKGIKPYVKRSKSTNTSNPTTDADAMIRIAAQGHKEAITLLEFRKIKKLCSTYLEMGIDEDNRLRSTISPNKAKTSRLSSSKSIFGTGGNLQNLPKPFRKYLLPDPGYIPYEMDLSQAENRLVAIIAPEPAMHQAFINKQDVHCLTGALISGKTPEEVLHEHLEGIPAPIGAGNKSWRYWGKTSNHALNYGLGPDKFALRCEILVSEAKLLRSAYYSAYPGITKYHNWIEEELRTTRTITNFFGRKRKFLGRFDNNLFQAAYAQIPQSTVADIINKRGLIPIYEDQKKFGCVILMSQVHDSIILQIPTYIPLEIHAKILYLIKMQIEEPIYWKGEPHVIPLAFSTGTNLYFGKEFEVTEGYTQTAENIREALDTAHE